MTITSISVLERLKANDQETWSVFVNSYRPYISSFVRSQGVANYEDIEQEVFQSIFNGLGKFQRQRDGSFRSWINTITLNCIRMSARKAFKEKAVLDNEALNHVPDSMLNISRILDEQHKRCSLDYALETVKNEIKDDDSWNAFVHHGIEGNAIEDAATKYDISISTLYVQKHRYLKRIREILETVND